MKRVYEGSDPDKFCHFLKENRIVAHLQDLSNTRSSMKIYNYPRDTVWVNEDGDAERALVLIPAFESSLASHREKLARQSPWHCSICLEFIEAEFDACWQCGTSG